MLLHKVSLAINSLNLLFYNKHKWYPLVQQQPLAQLGLFKLILKQNWFNVQWLLCGGCPCVIVSCALWVSWCPSRQSPITDSCVVLVFWGCSRYPYIPERGKPALFPINDCSALQMCLHFILYLFSFGTLCWCVLLCLVLYKPPKLGVLTPNGPFKYQGDCDKCPAWSWLQISDMI